MYEATCNRNCKVYSLYRRLSNAARYLVFFFLTLVRIISMERQYVNWVEASRIYFGYTSSSTSRKVVFNHNLC